MSAVSAGRSLLFVHAHPDDESIFTGATMAKYAAEGARVTLVTCTMGEFGINRLASGQERDHEQLAGLRARELDTACAALGVIDHRFLGGPGRWRDSGPQGAPAGNDPHCFQRADMDEAAGELIKVIHEVRPQVMVTYGADGFYGHPDHVKAHAVAWHSYQTACDPALVKFYTLTMPRSVLAAAIQETPWSAGRRLPPADDLRVGSPDSQVTTEIDATAYLGAKVTALTAHATQVAVDGPFFAAAGLMGIRTPGVEYYILVAGPGAAEHAHQAPAAERDLFSGIS